MRHAHLPRAADLPALAAFARGYLHEDVLAEHGSALDAATAFAHDASVDERRQLIDDLERVAHVFALVDRPANRGERATSTRTAGDAAERLKRFFSHDLRAAWTPETIDDLHALISRLRDSDDER